MAEDLPQLMTMSEVAKVFRVSPSTVHRWGRDGVLPAIVRGGVVRFRRQDIEEALTPTQRATDDEEPHAEAVA